jgi:hypothetical protein
VEPEESPAHVLVVAQEAVAPPALLDAVRARAERGPCWFFVLVPHPVPADWHPLQRAKTREAEHALREVVALVEEAAHRPADGIVSTRHDPMDAIEEAVHDDEFDEIILSTHPHAISRRLHLDLAHRVAHLGLPVTTVVTDTHISA